MKKHEHLKQALMGFSKLKKANKILQDQMKIKSELAQT